MIIRRIEADSRESYDRLVGEAGTIFNSLGWLANFGQSIKIYGIYDKGNKLIGGFHLFEEWRCGVTICRNAPFTPTCGPFFKDAARRPIAINDARKKILQSMAEFLDKVHYPVLSLSLSREVIDTQPFIWKKNKVVPHYTYLIDLDRSLDDMKKDMSIERRNDLRKAERDGLKVRKVDNNDLVKSLVLKTFARQNKKTREYYLDKLLFEFATDANSYAFVTFREDRPLSAAFCVRDKNTAYYLLGGYDAEVRHHGAGPLACWEAIRFAKELGLKCFDFEGSMVPAIERYFRGFGGTLTPYYTINKAKLPLEIILKMFKREFF